MTVIPFATRTVPVDFNARDARGFVRGRRTSDVADLDVGARVQLVDGDGELTGVADVVEVREKLLFFRVAWNTVRDLPRTLALHPSSDRFDPRPSSIRTAATAANYRPVVAAVS